ncbi:MAG: hypothetical protein WBA74_09120 [Cyclobacteriaceae bacterium]
MSRIHIRLIFLAAIFISANSSEVFSQEDEDLMHQKAIKTDKDTVVAAAGKSYQASGFKRFFWGDHYRDVWVEPVAIPILNLDQLKDGLEVIKQGGGMQTYSLKLKGGDGKLYAIRSIQKNPKPVIPKAVRETFVSDLVQDQISAAHPYGAFILPSLASAAEIYHTNPRLYYLPKNDNLEEFEQKFGNMVVMLEEDADEDWSQKKSFGYTENAIGTEKLLEELLDENEDYVDQHFFARARLFDMIIGDWDRHEGQWRWGEFEDENDNKYYRPIPEDRDNVFFKFDGFFPYWLSRKWSFRNLRTYHYDIKDIKGLNFNARYIDRRLLTGLSRQDWVEQAEKLKENLTDEKIRSAVETWPQEIFDISGEEIIAKIKYRRDRITDIANEYYEVLADQVIVFGSDEEEFFEIERTENGAIVSMYDLSDGEKDELLYKREFFSKETDEVIIYGYGGEDKYNVTGKSTDGIKLRLIGGEDIDKYTDQSSVRGLTNKTIIYDQKDSEIEDSEETRELVDSRLDLYKFDKSSFKYDVLAPVISFGYNVDDGVFIGGGFKLVNHGFGKEQFKASQRFEANVSTRTNIFNINYDLELTDVVGSGEFVFRAVVNAPNFRSNFFGLGNETEQVFDRDYYNYRINEMTFFPGLKFGDEYNSATFGMVYERYKLSNLSDFMQESETNFSTEARNFVGFRFASSVGNLDSKRVTRKGALWSTEMTLFNNLSEDNSNFSTLNSELKLFTTIDKTYTTFATRIGGAHTIGNVPFFKASRLGGNRGLNITGNLRGMVRDRFSGRTSLYQNLEIRQLLGKSSTYLANFAYGFNVFFDYGRVWQPEESSDVWHNSKGAGIWVALFYNWTITASYADSDVGNSVDVQLKFLF